MCEPRSGWQGLTGCNNNNPDLDNCWNQYKKDAYTYLVLQVKAAREAADIKGFPDPSVLTTGQTWDIRI